MSDAWQPRRAFALEDVLLTDSLGGLRVGDSQDDIVRLLGPPELPPARARNRRRWSWQYGNVTVSVFDARVEVVVVDLHGGRHPMVYPGSLGQWDRSRWLTFAEKHGWKTRELEGITHLRGPCALVAIEGTSGRLNTAVITARHRLHEGPGIG